MGKTLGWVGFGFSVIYVGLVSWLTIRRWGDFQTLKPNEIGDFLAGAFGPLAILWLILGFFQQGIELRQNSEALHLQAAELANSVGQQRELVKVARDQYESDREALQIQIDSLKEEREKQRRLSLPKFSIAAGGSHSVESAHTVTFSNYGNTCTELKIHLMEEQYSFTPDFYPLVQMGTGITSKLTLPRIPPFEKSFVKLSFLDSSGLPGELDYELTFRGDSSYSTLVLTLI